jgi:hypothetical protein
MKEYLPQLEGTNHKVIRRLRDPITKEWTTIYSKDGQLKQKGDHRGRGLRVVCKSCNNGWMSDLQTKAKPILIQFLEGQTPALTVVDQTAIAAWATMFSMVYEQADLEHAAIPQEERTYFQERFLPPKNWFIWMGIYDNSIKPEYQCSHRGMMLNPSKIGSEVSTICNTQTTVIFPQGIFLQTFSSTANGVGDFYRARLRQSANNFGLRQIWPYICPIQNWAAPITYPIVERIIESTTNVFA